MSYPPVRQSLDHHESSSSTIPASQVTFSTPYDPERGQAPGGHSARSSSWDLFSGIKKIEHSYEEFDTRHASEAHLVRADGDEPKGKVRLLIRVGCATDVTKDGAVL
ncbi:hypothetical protein H0H81_007525 [Sphagnurus paluster]|uniref:Uncharacterized protein n=1 Tax=Sphagnurus paluster TaxID=117069 RepID=A0A9P7GRD2_9AGAR|nr:hypothetical protein H0H81_007525 [Sphagnurus paluster]